MLILHCLTAGTGTGQEIVKVRLSGEQPGSTLIDSWVRPDDNSALRRLGVTSDDLRGAPDWPTMHDQLSRHLQGETVFTWDAAQTLAALEQCRKRHDLTLPSCRLLGVAPVYAEFWRQNGQVPKVKKALSAPIIHDFPFGIRSLWERTMREGNAKPVSITKTVEQQGGGALAPDDGLMFLVHKVLHQGWDSPYQASRRRLKEESERNNKPKHDRAEFQKKAHELLMPEGLTVTGNNRDTKYKCVDATGRRWPVFLKSEEHNAIPLSILRPTQLDRAAFIGVRIKKVRNKEDIEVVPLVLVRRAETPSSGLSAELFRDIPAGPEGTCSVCGVAHDSHMPHDYTSQRFRSMTLLDKGRLPRKVDAEKHCPEYVKNAHLRPFGDRALLKTRYQPPAFHVMRLDQPGVCPQMSRCGFTDRILSPYSPQDSAQSLYLVYSDDLKGGCLVATRTRSTGLVTDRLKEGVAMLLTWGFDDPDFGVSHLPAIIKAAQSATGCTVAIAQVQAPGFMPEIEMLQRMGFAIPDLMSNQVIALNAPINELLEIETHG